ncbi:hypothetical protein MHBO_003881, partial [Bonamia ostreae]
PLETFSLVFPTRELLRPGNKRLLESFQKRIANFCIGKYPLVYDVEDRRVVVLKYRDKRWTWNQEWDKETKYPRRKYFAESRPRVNGKFAKIRKDEFYEDE